MSVQYRVNNTVFDSYDDAVNYALSHAENIKATVKVYREEVVGVAEFKRVDTVTLVSNEQNLLRNPQP